MNLDRKRLLTLEHYERHFRHITGHSDNNLGRPYYILKALIVAISWPPERTRAAIDRGR